MRERQPERAEVAERAGRGQRDGRVAGAAVGRHDAAVAGEQVGRPEGTAARDLGLAVAGDVGGDGAGGTLGNEFLGRSVELGSGLETVGPPGDQRAGDVVGVQMCLRVERQPGPGDVGELAADDDLGFVIRVDVGDDRRRVELAVIHAYVARRRRGQTARRDLDGPPGLIGAVGMPDVDVAVPGGLNDVECVIAVEVGEHRRGNCAASRQPRERQRRARDRRPLHTETQDLGPSGLAVAVVVEDVDRPRRRGRDDIEGAVVA